MTAKSTFEISIQPILESLRKSPTFAMSLGAKELFHTNFLAFLLESKDPSVSSVSKRLKMRLLGDEFEGDVLVFREKNNLDLLVVPKLPDSATKFSAVIVEGKMKSIPTKSQLMEYSEKISDGIKVDVGVENCIYVEIRQEGARYRVIGQDGKKSWVNVKKVARKILLAPTQPFEDETWDFMEWSCISSDIKAGLKFSSGTESNTEVSSVIKSYARDLDNLIDLLKLADEFVDSFCQSESKITFGDFNDSLKESFQSVRIHDLVSKYSYWRLSRKLEPFIESAKLEVDFTNGSPILHMWNCIDNNKYRIGVQIQANQYRHFLESVEPSEDLTAFIEKGGYLSKWFITISESSTNELKSIKDLNRYGANKFLYSKINVESYDFERLAHLLNKSFMNCPV